MGGGDKIFKKREVRGLEKKQKILLDGYGNKNDFAKSENYGEA